MRVVWEGDGIVSAVMAIQYKKPTDMVMRESWISALADPTVQQLGFDLPRKQWSLLNHFRMLNRFRTAQGQCGLYRKRWRLTELGPSVARPR